MKPTPTQIEAAARSLWERLSPDFTFDEARRLNHSQYVWVMGDAEAALSAALSVPAAAVVGEPVAYASSKEWRKNHLMSAVQYKSALPKNVVDFDIPLYATLPNEALVRSEQATFDIAARLLKERDALASRISQQDAELERMRREVEEVRQVADDRLSDNARLTNEKADALFALAEARKAAFIEAAEIAASSARDLRNGNAYRFAASKIASLLRAKAEETRI